MRLAAALFSVLIVFGMSHGPAMAGSDGSIGVYADLSATQTSATFSIGVPRTLFVIARLEGATAGGMTGAEFRIDGLPTDWFVFVTPNPAANVVLGDPFRVSGSEHRANIVFPGCPSGTSGRVLLYTAVVIANSEIAPGDLTVLAGNPPSNPNFTTPILTRCDAPEFTTVPAGGGSFRIEVRAPQDLDYALLPGYDGLRGVMPSQGLPGDVFHFRVSYSSADGQAPALGSPWLELDANGDGDTDDPGDGRLTTLPADLDSTLTNGKDYRFDVALAAPPGGQYSYRFTATDHHGAPVPGSATVWQDSLFVSSDLADLSVHAEDIRAIPSHPGVNETCALVARVENRSARQVTGVVVRIEDVFGNPIAERTLSTLGPFATTEVACSWRFRDSGFQPFVVRVDPNNEIAERSEADNVASHAVFVGGPAISGTLSISGLPPLVTVPPVAPFGIFGSARYNGAGGVPTSPVRGGQLTVRPSWESAWSVRLDGEGAFDTRIVPPAVPGSYQVTFRVSDGARDDSTTVQLQLAPLPGQSPPHGPNLALRIDWALAAGCPASQALLSGTIENTGDASAAPTQVRVLAADLSTVAVVDVGSVAAGAVLPLGPILVPIVGPGPHAFTAHIDPANTLRELRDDDNIAIAGGRSPSPCFDLDLESMRFTGTRICAGEEITISARITNRSCEGSQAGRLAWTAGGGEIESAVVPALVAGETVEIGMAHVFEAIGCDDLELVLEGEGTSTPDCNTQNNRLGAASCPGMCGPLPPPSGPNFSIAACDLSVSNPHPSLGDPIRFRAIVRNLGAGNSLAMIHVGFDIDGVPIGDPLSIASLPAGQSRVVETAVTWPASFAPHYLTATLFTHGQPHTGAVASRGLPWDLQPLVIGTCPPSDPSMFSTCTPCQGIPIQIRAVIANQGLFDCDSVQVEFRDTVSGIGSGLSSARTALIPAGSHCVAQNALVSVMHTFATTGLHLVNVVVDPEDELAESSEINNTFARDVTVTCGVLPDLVARLRVPGPAPTPGDTVRAVEVTVENLGIALASNVQASLRLNGTPLCDLEMGSVAPGGLSTVVCTARWVAADVGCTQLLLACADPANQIAELNEGNNCATGGVSGSGQTDLALHTSGITIQPPNPQPGQPVIIAVTVFSLQGIESQCRLVAEWSFDSVAWFPIGEVPLHIPGSISHFPDAATFAWVPPDDELFLRFSLVEICPFDVNEYDNIAIGTLPWFVPTPTPVTVSNFAATSKPDGVLLQWSAEESVDRFVLERRTSGDLEWERLSVSIVTEMARGDWEALDRDAPPAAQLDYRLLAQVSGEEEVAANLTVTHSAARREMQLHGVRPHPFRPGSTIEFTLPESRPIDLGIFDAAGRRVRGLRRGSESAGRHGVSWDGRDDQGARLPAGVYFCRLVAGSFQQTQRIVLLH